jgi:hypothetical protein
VRCQISWPQLLLQLLLRLLLPTGVELDPTCPALGATILDATRVGVDSNQIFSLPSYMLDAFGSLITSGPGSDWVLALQLPNALGECSD